MSDVSTARAKNGGVLHEIERASVDELRSLQLERLQWSLRHAYDQSAFYRRRFDAHAVHPDDLRQLEDLAKFPLTTKADLRDTYPFGMFAVPRERVARIHASSGTTGKPTVVGYTAKDIDTWSEAVARSIHAAGGRPGDRVHVAYGYGLFTGGLGAHYGAERLGCTVVPMSGGQTEKQALLIQDLDPDIIMVTPSYVLNIADELERQGADPAKLALRCGIFGAEPWTDRLRGEIEARLRIDALDIYGLSEVIGPGVAQECLETKDGPTIWEDWFYPEIVDPDTGGPVEDGAEGELVFTSLTKEALPVIRYRTRDLTRLLPGSVRPMRRMARITGRSDDMLIIRGVNVFPTQVEEAILGVAKLAPHYRLEVRRERHLDAVTVAVELRPGFEDAESTAIEHDTRNRIKALIGISCDVRVGPPGSVPRSQGKAQRVLDTREK